jgi:hypothetical protein
MCSIASFHIFFSIILVPLLSYKREREKRGKYERKGRKSKVSLISEINAKGGKLKGNKTREE